MKTSIRLLSTPTIPQKLGRKTFEDFSQRNNIREQDWYGVDIQTFDEPTATLLKEQFRGSLYHALSSLFPEREWLPWKFQQKSIPPNYWKSTQNQRKYFDWLGKEIGIKKTDDWYTKLSNETLKENGGSGLLALTKGARAALMSAYPEHSWTLSKFKVERRGLWSSLEVQTDYFSRLGKALGIQHLDDWYEKLTVDVLRANGGAGLLNLKQSPVSVLVAVYPEHNWMPWKFNNMMEQPGLWSSPEVQKKFFDWLGKELKIETLDEWYEKLSVSTIQEHGGQGLLAYFRASPRAALMAAYPNHNWITWKFKHTKARWDSHDNMKQLLSELSEKLSIQTLDDWYRVDAKQLRLFGANAYLIIKHKGLHNILKEQYPNHPWDPSKFRQTGRKAQRWLVVTLKKMFPDEEILEDYQHPKARFQSSGRPMQLDVYIPSRSLALEYQGEHHYEEVSIFGPSTMYQQRDEEKRALCAANNIRLIEVPYWWNRTQEALQKMITKQSGVDSL